MQRVYRLTLSVCAGLCGDRLRARGEEPGDHHQRGPPGVPDGQEALRPHRLPGARRLHQEHDHWRLPDGRLYPRRRRHRRLHATDQRARPTRQTARRQEHCGEYTTIVFFVQSWVKTYRSDS